MLYSYQLEWSTPNRKREILASGFTLFGNTKDCSHVAFLILLVSSPSFDVRLACFGAIETEVEQSGGAW